MTLRTVHYAGLSRWMACNPTRQRSPPGDIVHQRGAVCIRVSFERECEYQARMRAASNLHIGSIVIRHQVSVFLLLLELR